MPPCPTTGKIAGHWARTPRQPAASWTTYVRHGSTSPLDPPLPSKYAARVPSCCFATDTQARLTGQVPRLSTNSAAPCAFAVATAASRAEAKVLPDDEIGGSVMIAIGGAGAVFSGVYRSGGSTRSGVEPPLTVTGKGAGDAEGLSG